MAAGDATARDERPAAGRRRRHAPGSVGDAVDLAGLVVAELLVAVLAVVRWPGHPPFGSDHDEYRMLAESLYGSGSALIGGVEGTKYPLGWSLLIGLFDRLGADLTVAAIAINLVAVAATVLVVWLIGRRFGSADPSRPRSGAAAVAAIAVAVGASLWGSVYAVMPDTLLTLVTAVGFWWVLQLDDPPDAELQTTTSGRLVRGRLPSPDPAALRAVAWLSGLAAAAVLLKTAGLVLAGALTVALFVRTRYRLWSWAPAAVGLLLTGLQTLFVARYPEHTTGYGATFWLRDPYDAARGEITPGELPARVIDRIDLFWTDAAAAVLGRHVPSSIGIAVTLALLALAIIGYRRWRWSVVSFLVVYSLLLAAWPYRSPRFGLPLVPLAAAGLGVLVATSRAIAGTATAVVVAVALVVPHAVGNVGELRTDAEVEERQLAELHAATDDLAAWLDANVPPEVPIASMDYREIAYRTGREVLPIHYTSDPDALLAASAGRGARYLVVLRGLYGRREARIDALLSTHPDRFVLVRSDARVDVYLILPEGDTP